MPACHVCQTAKSKGEQSLWKLINIDVQGETHPVAEKNRTEILGDELRIQQELKRVGPLAKALEGRTFYDLELPSGIAGSSSGAQLE